MSNKSPGKAANIVGWILQSVLALAFLAAGGAKLAGAPMMVETFEFVGLGQWFRYATAVIEIAGAIALLAPGFTVLGAVILSVTMVGAIIAHLTVIPSSFAPALVLLVLLLVVLWLRRDQIPELRTRLAGAA
ncbi:MAG: DoxX family protein [Rhizobiaceae bacterium]|nr:DoxX family protein [Rhizobiaceae bacterium]MCV0405830.1 DoxX family protein [Rhizobiaceae bacterium]